MPEKSSTPLKGISEALQAFQSKFIAAGTDGRNEYGKYDYTSLKQTLRAVQPALELGLCHTITCHVTGTDFLVVRLTLRHVGSGETLESEMLVPNATGEKNSMQALGSAITYAKKYLLWGAYGLANDDDDGESSTGGQESAPRTAPVKKLVTPTEGPKKAPTPEKKGVVFLDDARKEKIVAALRTHPDKSSILDGFLTKCLPSKSKAYKPGPSDIQLPEHGDYLEPLLGITSAA